MAIVPIFRIDADAHGESMVLPRTRTVETRYKHLPRSKKRETVPRQTSTQDVEFCSGVSRFPQGNRRHA
jgi:hypothetical protein